MPVTVSNIEIAEAIIMRENGTKQIEEIREEVIQLVVAPINIGLWLEI